MILFIYLFILFIVCVYLYMHMYNFLCSDSLLYFFLFLSTLHSVYTRDCSCMSIHTMNICTLNKFIDNPALVTRICIMWSCRVAILFVVLSN